MGCLSDGLEGCYQEQALSRKDDRHCQYCEWDCLISQGASVDGFQRCRCDSREGDPGRKDCQIDQSCCDAEFVGDCPWSIAGVAG